MQIFFDTKLAILTITGDNVSSFLQGQLTTNLNNLAVMHCQPTALCQYQGKTLAHGYIYMEHAARAHFLLPEASIALVTQTLQPFAALERMELNAPNPKNYPVVGLITKNICPNLPKQRNQIIQINQSMHILCMHTDPYVYLVQGPMVEVTQWATQFSSAQVQRHTNWQAALIEQNILFLPPQASGLYTPNMLGLVPSPSVSLRKGCYVGQEVIARTYHLGQVKRTLHTFQCPTLKAPLPTNTILEIVSTSGTARVLQSGYDGTQLWFQAIMLQASAPYEFILPKDEATHSSQLVFEAKLFPRTDSSVKEIK